RGESSHPPIPHSGLSRVARAADIEAEATATLLDRFDARMNLSDSMKSYMASEQNFNLIELLVVIVIIGILVAIAVPSYLSFRTKAQTAAAQSNVRTEIGSASGRESVKCCVNATPNSNDSHSGEKPRN